MAQIRSGLLYNGTNAGQQARKEGSFSLEESPVILASFNLSAPVGIQYYLAAVDQWFDVVVDGKVLSLTPDQTFKALTVQGAYRIKPGDATGNAVIWFRECDNVPEWNWGNAYGEGSSPSAGLATEATLLDVLSEGKAANATLADTLTEEQLQTLDLDQILVELQKLTEAHPQEAKLEELATGAAWAPPANLQSFTVVVFAGSAMVDGKSIPQGGSLSWSVSAHADTLAVIPSVVGGPEADTRVIVQTMVHP